MTSTEDAYKAAQAAWSPPGPPQRRPAAAVAVLADTPSGPLILLARRAASLRFLPGYWTFPGGLLDEGETAREAACRELFEEVGLRASPEELEPAGVFRTPGFSTHGFEANYFVLRRSAKEPLKLGGDEVEDAVWLAPSEALREFAGGARMIPSPVRRLVEVLAKGDHELGERGKKAGIREDADPQLWELAAGVSVIPLRTPTLPPATHTNCYVVGSEELVLVDPAPTDVGEQERLWQVIDERVRAGSRVVAVWLTHHHADHIGAATAASDRYEVPIAAHPATREALAGSVEVGAPLREGTRLVLGGSVERSLRCMWTPGHAPGHLCFLEESTGYLIAGDMVASEGTILVDPSEGDMSLYIESLRRLRQLEPSALLPAHGLAIATPLRHLDHYISHRLAREAKVEAALGASLQTPAQLVVVAYADTPAAIHWLATRSMLSHLEKLEREGRAECQEGRWRRASRP